MSKFQNGLIDSDTPEYLEFIVRLGCECSHCIEI